MKSTHQLKFFPLLLVATSCLATSFTFNGTGGSIPDATTFITSPGIFNSDIVVANAFSVSDVEVRLIGLSHPFVGDLRATLTNVQTGTQVSLFRQIGELAATHSCAGNPIPGANCRNGLSGDYAFKDSFIGNLWLASGTNPIPGGNYFPTGGNGAATSLVGGFGGTDSAATWRLTLGDYERGDTGSLQSWQLVLTDGGASVPEPAVGLLVAPLFAAFVFARRKSARQ